MERRVNDSQQFRFPNDQRIENQSLEAPHVSLIDVLPDRAHFALSIFWNRCERFGRDRVHLRNDPAGVWLNYLRAVAEINLVAIIVRGVVTRRDHDARAGFEVTNRKRKLRHRARAVEHARVATVFSCDFGRKFRELFREKARIMRDHEPWSRGYFLASVPIVQISDKSPRCTVDIKKIHRVRTDTGKLRSLVFACIPALRSRNDFANRAPAQSASSECKRLVETIV